MIGLALSTLLGALLGVGAALGLFCIVAFIVEWLDGRSKVQRYAQQRQREMIHERWVQSDSAMRMLDDLRRQFRDRP